MHSAQFCVIILLPYFQFETKHNQYTKLVEML